MNKFTLYAGLFSFLISPSCGEIMDAPELPVSDPIFFREVIQEKVVDLDEFLVYYSFGEEFDYIDPLLHEICPDINITAYVISYNTVDVSGHPIIASGTIYYPQDYHIRGVIEVPPIAFIQNTSGASDRVPAVEALQSCFGYITLIPDFLGYGISKDIIHPFIQVENNGRVAYDFRQAAREFLRTINYTLPDRTQIGGYSLGGSLALAMAKYYQLYGKDVYIERVALGCGCYDPITAFEVFQKTETSGYPLIPTIIRSMDYHYKLNLDYSKVFIGDLLENYQDWLDCSQEHDSSFMHKNVGTNLRNFMHPDFFTEEKNPEFKRLYNYLKYNSHVDGWTPNFPLYIYHAVDDEAVPYECGVYAYEEFKKRGADVRLYNGTGGHVGYAEQLFVTLYLSLLIK